MLVLIAELVWLCRHLESAHKRAIWATACPGADFSQVSCYGERSASPRPPSAPPSLLATHLRVVAIGLTPDGCQFRAHISSIGLASGIAVALLEETVMRGAMHTAIERESGPWTAALLTAPLFAVLHFFAKARIRAAGLGWGSGFDLLLRSFSPLGHPALVFDAFLSWLHGGTDLEPHPRAHRQYRGGDRAARRLGGGAAHAAGSDRQRRWRRGYSLWVGRFDGLLGYWLLPWGACIAAALWLTRARWVPPARR